MNIETFWFAWGEINESTEGTPNWLIIHITILHVTWNTDAHHMYSNNLSVQRQMRNDNERILGTLLAGHLQIPKSAHRVRIVEYALLYTYKGIFYWFF